VQFASAVTTTRPLDVLRFQLHDPGTVPMVDGLVRNPTQTALADVTVTIRFLSKTGTLLRTVKVPADCIVLDGLATTTFRAVMREGEVYSKYITVTASGKPTFRRPLFLPVHLDSWTCWSDGAETGHNYTVSVTNDRPFDVVGVRVWGAEWLGADSRTPGFYQSITRALPGAGALASDETTTFVFGSRGYVSDGEPTLTVRAEAIPMPAPGINMDTTVVACASGATAAIAGTVLDDQATAAVGAATVLCRTSADGVTWSAPTTLTTSSAGRFSTTRVATRARLYSFTYAGRAGIASPSGPVIVKLYPRVVLAAPQGRSTPPAHTDFTVSGSLTPHHAPGTIVNLLAYHQVDGAWVLGAESTATVADGAGGVSNYAGSIAVPSFGTWRIVAAMADDFEHSYTVSAAKTIVAGHTAMSVTAS
jgi:hypothetical protein